MEQDFEIEVRVDEKGCYHREMGHALDGKEVTGDGQEAALKLLAKDVLVRKPYTHSYPLDWRTKKPVIVRASKQWFLDTEKLREAALKAVKEVNVMAEDPKKDRGPTMEAQVSSSPQWCLSRQRVWGLPIPVFFNEDDADTALTQTIASHMTNIIRKNGSDSWWTKSVNELGAPIIKALEGKNVHTHMKVRHVGDHVSKSEDILDVWFESGCSWKCALGENETPDLVIEGLDQFRGWFYTSLMTSVALRGKAPFKNILVHGFAVDEKGKKMSKSEGNVVVPREIIEGTKKRPPLGLDGLRLWVALYGSGHSRIRVGDEVLSTVAQGMKHIRLAYKFMLGNIGDLDAKLPYSELLKTDQYALAVTYEFLEEFKSALEAYDFNVAANLLLRFINGSLSKNYFSCVKNRLYLDFADSPSRRSVQTAMALIGETIARATAPLLPVLSEEYLSAQGKLNGLPKESCLLEGWPEIPEEWNNVKLKSDFETYLIPIRNEAIQIAERAGDISKHGMELLLSDRVYEIIKPMHDGKILEMRHWSELAHFMRTSYVELVPNRPDERLRTDYRLTMVACFPGTNPCKRCRKIAPRPAMTDMCEHCERVTGLKGVRIPETEDKLMRVDVITDEEVKRHFKFRADRRRS